MKIKQELSSIELKYNQNHNREENTDRVTDRIDRKINLINYNRKWLVDYSWLDKIKLSKNESFTDLIDTNEYVLENQYWLD